MKHKRRQDGPPGIALDGRSGDSGPELPRDAVGGAAAEAEAADSVAEHLRELRAQVQHPAAKRAIPGGSRRGGISGSNSASAGAPVDARADVRGGIPAHALRPCQATGAATPATHARSVGNMVGCIDLVTPEGAGVTSSATQPPAAVSSRGTGQSLADRAAGGADEHPAGCGVDAPPAAHQHDVDELLQEAMEEMATRDGTGGADAHGYAGAGAQGRGADGTGASALGGARLDASAAGVKVEPGFVEAGDGSGDENDGGLGALIAELEGVLTQQEAALQEAETAAATSSPGAAEAKQLQRLRERVHTMGQLFSDMQRGIELMPSNDVLHAGALDSIDDADADAPAAAAAPQAQKVVCLDGASDQVRPCLLSTLCVLYVVMHFRVSEWLRLRPCDDSRKDAVPVRRPTRCRRRRWMLRRRRQRRRRPCSDAPTGRRPARSRSRAPRGARLRRRTTSRRWRPPTPVRRCTTRSWSSCATPRRARRRCVMSSTSSMQCASASACMHACMHTPPPPTIRMGSLQPR